MSLVGGFVATDPRRPVAASVGEAMAAVVPGTKTVAVLTAGPAVVFVAGPADPPRLLHGRLVAADLALTNLAELRALVGGDDPLATVAALYEREGPRGVERLRGGFALAIQEDHGEILLAVDQVGIKRLFYGSGPAGFAFASRPAAVAAAPGASRAVDLLGVYLYLNYGFVPAPHSAFQGVRRLAPGHIVLVREGQPRETRYWDLAYPEGPAAESEMAASLVEHAEAAVARCLPGPSPKEIGAFLSGGTDSSAILGLAARLTGEHVPAFSIGFAERHYDELDFAEIAARHFEATHYTRVITPDEALPTVPRLVDAYDEPFGNGSAIGTYLCAQLAQDSGMARLLAGDGGDEIFGGNERYRKDQIFARYHRLPAWLRRGLLEPVLATLPDGGASPLGKAQRYVRRATTPHPRRFYAWELYFSQEGRALLDPGLVYAAGPDAAWALAEEHFGRVQATSELNRLLYLDMKLAIGDNDLLKVTRTAELAGVDVRFPFLDLPLVELTGRWPAAFKVRGLEKRHLFKRAFRTLLPPEILAKRKHGFGVPTSVWLRHHPGFRSLLEDTLRSAPARQRGYFVPGGVQALLDRHAGDSTAYYGDLLWAVLMLELWHRRHVDAEVAR